MIFKEELYLRTDNYGTGFEVWRTSDGETWNQVYDDGFGDAANTFGLPMVGGDYLYLVTGNFVSGVQVWRSSDGVT